MSGQADWRGELYARYLSTHSIAGGDVDAGDRARSVARIRAKFRPLLPDSKSARILDVGCGHGLFVHSARTLGYASTSGVDRSSEQIALGKRLGIPGLFQGDAIGYLQSAPTAYDCITALDVLEHCTKPDVLALLTAAHDALVPGGRVVIQTINGGGIRGSHLLYGDFTHEWAFTATSIAQLLQACGFHAVTVSEDKPIAHSAKSRLRSLIWQGVRLPRWALTIVETGTIQPVILTANLIATAYRPMAARRAYEAIGGRA